MLFLIFEPRGLAAIWLRIKAYFKIMAVLVLLPPEEEDVMRRKGFVALAAIAALALVGAGCGQDDDEESAAAEATAPRSSAFPGFDGTTIKLGVLTPLTGPVAVIGEPLTAGNEVYFESVNKKGGIAGKYKVELEQADTQYAPDRPSSSTTG